MRVFSTGLGSNDIELQINDRSDVDDGVALVQTIVDYVESSKRMLKNGETFAYGFWLIRFDRGAERFSISEYSSDASSFVRGADLAIRLWRDQHAVCRAFSAPFDPPRADQLVATSKGVHEGDVVQGVRYEAPEHMSGWYLTTGRYDGNVDSLMVEHLYHVLDRRPDLARYVALPPGYRFDTTSGDDDVWLDD